MIFASLISLILFTSSEQVHLNLEEGETCLDTRDGKWTCIVEYDCPRVDQSAVRPAICSYRRETPIVCCPHAAKQRSQAELACERYEQLRCANEKGGKGDVIFLPLIVGGVESKAKSRPEAEIITRAGAQRPHRRYLCQTDRHLVGIVADNCVALLGRGNKGRIRWVCGGSLISEKWVLTAAHCTSPRVNKKGLQWVRLGELDLSTSGDNARPEDRKIIRKILHPGFKWPAMYNDIALLEMDRPVKFNEYISPICLHTSFGISHMNATVVGWGSTGTGQTSKKLLEAEISLLSHEKCSKIYTRDPYLIPRGIDEKSMICAGEDIGGKDACQGDSGGPFIVQAPGRCISSQIGIVSFGKGCGLANAPGVYTRVSLYVKWIESIVWPNISSTPRIESEISSEPEDKIMFID